MLIDQTINRFTYLKQLIKHNAKSVRAFLGASNFAQSRQFYQELGFEESVISADMSYFRIKSLFGFYLQDAYVKDWIDNTMIFLEVDDVDEYWNELQSLGLHERFENVRLTPIKKYDWGK